MKSSHSTRKSIHETSRNSRKTLCRGGVRRSRGSEKRKFDVYCAYAFGTPFVISLIVLIIDKTESIPDEFRPMLGYGKCLMQDKDKIVDLVFVYPLIVIILIVNAVFYSITAYKIYKAQKDTSIIRKGDSKRHSTQDLDRSK